MKWGNRFTLPAVRRALPVGSLLSLKLYQARPPKGGPSEALRDVVREIDRRLGKEANHAEAIRLMTAAYILTGLRVPKGDLASIYRGIGLMQESTAFDEVMEEGERRGQVRGELDRSHRLLLRQGRKRFGPPDAAMESTLTTIKDLERLERMADAILTAESWQELLATP